MFTRLLVGLDGSPGADAALEAALGLGRRFKTTIVLAAITDIRLLEAPLFETTGPLWTEGLPAAPIAVELREALEERAARILETATARVAQAGLKSEPVRAVGLADEELIRLADQAEAIVVGRRGELHGEPGTLGAVTVRIIKRSPKPVLVAGETPSSCERPVVALDGGETSNHALELAARYAEALGIPLTLVHVTDDAAAGDELLAKAAAFLSEHGVSPQTQRLSGDVTRSISGFLAEHGADLLIAGAHGGRRHLWAFGSHAEKLLRAATVPVIIHR
jgi:nucleotide-binding universal stress UspA family protein